jgi:hypothetical protein
LHAPIEHGKTSLISIALPLFVLGTNPNARIAIISETATQATRILAAIREHILGNPRLREVFPRLRPARGAREQWSDSSIVIERSVTSKDASIIALGELGPLTGARLDLAILDDVLSWSSTCTETLREKTISWFKSTLIGRMVEKGKIIVAGSAWHEEDLLHVLAQSSEYFAIRDPAIRSNGAPLWPEQWSSERLAQRRREMGEGEFSRQLLVQAKTDADSRFKIEWIERAFAIAEERGAKLVHSYSGPWRTFTGVDLAVGGDAHHDETVIFSIALLPDGRRQVLGIEAGRWTAPLIVGKISEACVRYGGIVRVESNGAQEYVTQFLKADFIRVESHHTGRNRHDPAFGIESLAVELEQQKWIVPEGDETRKWAKELLSYSPRAHAGDRLIGSWLAREAARAHDHSAPLGIVAGQSIYSRDASCDEGDVADDDDLWALHGEGGAHPLEEHERAGRRFIGGGSPGAPRMRPRKKTFVMR